LDLPLPRRGVLRGKSGAHEPPLAAVLGAHEQFFRRCIDYRAPLRL
jgi:hypothetical protein